MATRSGREALSHQLTEVLGHGPAGVEEVGDHHGKPALDRRRCRRGV